MAVLLNSSGLILCHSFIACKGDLLSYAQKLVTAIIRRRLEVA